MKELKKYIFESNSYYSEFIELSTDDLTQEGLYKIISGLITFNFEEEFKINKNIVIIKTIQIASDYNSFKELCETFGLIEIKSSLKSYKEKELSKIKVRDLDYTDEDYNDIIYEYIFDMNKVIEYINKKYNKNLMKYIEENESTLGYY